MPKEFVPRDWQDRFVRDYQTNPKKNFLVEACTSAGKTGGSLYAYDSLKDGLDWRFLVVVVPAEHLRRQYAKDAANLFGLNLYYTGTDKRLGRLPNPEELLQQGYQGIVLSYQWLTKSGNAELLKTALGRTLTGKIFVILDEVHHASSEMAFGQSCEIAFPDHIVSHRLMTSGTPFRSDNNRILGRWVNYLSVEENVYECVPDFRYTLADALSDQIVPVFSFVTMAGEFAYRRGRAVYEGKTFTNAQNEQELVDALNTAIYVDGDWVKEAIVWAYERMQRDRIQGIPECATYVRVSTIRAAHQMRERIRSLTGEEALVVVSSYDELGADYNRSASTQDPSELIERFASATGLTAQSWIIGVSMLGEGVSINRLKYRIHATNVRAPLSFMQDLGRLLRLYPEDAPEPVETLIPAHPMLIQLALDAMNKIAHVVLDLQPETLVGDEDENGSGEENQESLSSNFEPLASTGELGAQIVDGEEISNRFTSVAEWAVANKEIWRHWGKTPAHLAQMLQKEPGLFELLRQEYEVAFEKTATNSSASEADVPLGFPSEYAGYLSDQKIKFARKEANTKANRLAFLLYHSASDEERKEKLKQIHTIAKQRNGLPIKDSFIGHEGWERVYLWLCNRIADAENLKGTEDL